MKTLFGFVLFLLGCIFMGMTIDDSIIGNSISKILGALCIIRFWKNMPVNDSLYKLK